MKRIRQISFGYVQIVLGLVFASLGLKGFLLPNSFLDGGVTGIALLLEYVTSWDASLLLIVINIPFLLLAYRRGMRRLFWRSIVTVILLAILIYVEDYPTITEDKLLIAIFGGLFLGMGIGFAIRGGAVLDGSEILGIYLSQRLRTSVGRIILIFNIILFAVTAFVINVEVALYSILTYIVAAKATDFVIRGFEEYIGITIVSGRHEAIRRALIEEMGVGVTIYRGAGGRDPQELDILHSIITRLELRRLYQVVEAIDEQAFITEYDVNDLKGGVVKKMFGEARL
ncbi:MAG: YitT family protein [Lewinella sp.]|nr:YitT family protein [Lewinella sp.]